MHLDRKSKSGVSVSGILFALFTIAVTLAVAYEAKVILDKNSKVVDGGTPYMVCFWLAGGSMALVMLYSSYMAMTQWSNRRFVLAVRAAFWFSLVDAVACSLWFILRTGLFSFPGVVGILFAILSTFWATALCNAYLRHEAAEKCHRAKDTFVAADTA